MDERVLFVEDDPAIRDLTSKGLEQAGYDVSGEADGRQALIRFRQEDFDVVLLDVMLPSLSGIEVCRHIRAESTTPIVMLTAKTETTDVVLGLEAGADDYVTKPFEIEELLARLRAVLRRANPSVDNARIQAHGLEIDPDAFVVSKDGNELTLTATEFRLLVDLAQARGKVRTREVLLESVWNYDYLGDSRIVDMAIKRLREKIEDDHHDPKIITTVRGVGYRFEA